MVDIEPYQYQKTTNIKEHNDIVAKINEIVDVINNSGTDTLGPRISKLETDVSALDSAVKIQYQDIASIKDKDQAQDNNIRTLDAQVKGITESLISDVNVIDGMTTGKFKVRLDREKAPSIDSNDYDLQKATSIELIQGSGPSMVKAQITLSDGTILRSDDFLFTTEAIGTDVYISSFVFKNGNVDGTISADIGLSNGSTLEANNFVVPMDPSLINTVQDLSTRLSAVEGGSVAGFAELEAQVNTNKNNIATLTTDIDDLDISKADQSNPSQTIKADITDLRTVKLRDSTDAVGSYLQFNADANKPVRMEYFNGSEVVDSGYVATVDIDGKPKNFSGGTNVMPICVRIDITNYLDSEYTLSQTNENLMNVFMSSWVTEFNKVLVGTYSYDENTTSNGVIKAYLDKNKINALMNEIFSKFEIPDNYNCNVGIISLSKFGNGYSPKRSKRWGVSRQNGVYSLSDTTPYFYIDNVVKYNNDHNYRFVTLMLSADSYFTPL